MAPPPAWLCASFQLRPKTSRTLIAYLGAALPICERQYVNSGSTVCPALPTIQLVTTHGEHGLEHERDAQIRLSVVTRLGFRRWFRWLMAWLGRAFSDGQCPTYGPADDVVLYSTRFFEKWDRNHRYEAKHGTSVLQRNALVFQTRRNAVFN